jgi:hypothetical protein
MPETAAAAPAPAPAGPPVAITQAGQAAQARLQAQADPTTEGGAPNPAAQTTAGGTALETNTAEGGGAQGATVNGDGGAARNRGPTVVHKNGRVESVTFRLDDGNKLIKKRPVSSSKHAPFWRWIDKQYFGNKRGQEDSKAMDAISQSAAARRPHLFRQSGAGGGGAPSSSAGRATIDPQRGLVFELAEKPLLEHVKASIEQRWFLRLVEETKHTDGRNYVPGLRINRKQRGSLCGRFPHMIYKHTFRDDGHRSTTLDTFFCGGDRLLRFDVELMERKDAGATAKVGEAELLKLVTEPSYTTAERKKFGPYQTSLTVYASLEWYEGPDKGKPVMPSAFKLQPESIFLSAESAPYHSGATEKVMSDGRARIDKLKLGKHVTHANMKEEHKKHQVCVAIHTLNPMLHQLNGFTVKSSPFFIKAVCHNDVERNERYCLGTNGVPEAVTLA